MGFRFAQVKARRSTLEAMITRADGTVEHLGVIAYYHRNPIRRWSVSLWIHVRRRFHPWRK
jgi:hypothetical protein